jgi:addiction module HigA family antidote
MSAQKRKDSAVGAYIRRHVIPTGMSVKEAAKRMGVGRPALSNLLNGNASLSPEMALRFEKAFGADRQKLLDLQAAADANSRRDTAKAVAVRAYVPNFLTIKAKQIDDWPDGNLDARNHLPVLLRRLIHSTSHELRHVDFPGYDNAQRHGWDGWIEADAATAWIPAGTSGWEFGTDEDPRAKAEKDYKARVASVPAAERANCTFVFVTPRNWPGKTEWARKKNESGDWKAVRALDASDLEQWIEESIPAQMWLAEKLGMPVTGFETPEHCWDRWAAASKPPMSPEFFAPSIAAHRGKLKAWLDKASDRVFVVSADSKDEALAFLTCLFRDPEIAARANDLAAVFHSSDTLRTLAASSSPFIPIVTTQEAERELVSLHPRLHCIAIRPRNAVDSEPDIALDLLNHEAFEKALAAMGIEGHEVERLERASGLSPTILRRQLSDIDAIRTPVWARDQKISRSLIPMTLVGAWHAKSNADREVLAALAGCPYDEIEESLAQLLQQDDSPVWAVGQHRGVASKIDALFATSKWVTVSDLETFFRVAADVLSESDPALDLPEDQRWAAGMYGKVRNHSEALRRGICETLVILSVHGNNLFRDRLGVDVDAQVALLIRRLLDPLTLDKLLSHDDDLPRYAEAAPDEFLTLLEADLKRPEPSVLGLLKPAGSGVFGGCPRSGLLWALEGLAWKRLGRVTAILAQLSRTVINDNWANKPIGSLEAIYRSWMPQTAASLEDRKKALEALTKRYPDIGWQICVEQFDPHSRTGHYSHKPHWRNDAAGAGEPVRTRKEIYEFCRKALDLALAWPSHDEKTLGDLVERIDGLADEDQSRVWDLIDAWAEKTGDDAARAELRERIRRFAFTRRGRRRGLKPTTTDRARSAYAKLTPEDPVIRHGWLFSKQWVEESSDEIGDVDLDYTKRDERIHQQRLDAMLEIWRERGFDGISALLEQSEAPHTIGRYAALCMSGSQESDDFIRRCLAVTNEKARRFDGCMEGFLISLDAAARTGVISSAAKDAEEEVIARLFRCAPFEQATWRQLDDYSEQIRQRYWRDVTPTWHRHGDAEISELIDRLLEVKRPRAAFFAVHMECEKVETSRLKRLLRAIPTDSEEAAGTYQLDRHYLTDALDSLDGRAGVTRDEMANLEFLYLAALDRTDRGIPNLERQISESPTLYVQAIALTYKRSDDGEDPQEWRVNPDRRSAVATATHRLLDQIRRIPGTDENGNINAESLAQWLAEVRRLCAEHSRAEIGDQCIGQLLSRSTAEDDGMRPCLAICEAIEPIGSPDIATGFAIGVYNARGVHWRGEGGAQERGLAEHYRDWAKRRAFDYPYVSSVLERIAASYDRDAEWQDSEAKVRRRLRR